MRGRKFRILSSLALSLALILCGCNKVDTGPQLFIQVLDETGNKVSGAYVALFDNEDEWNRRLNPAQVWRRTDSEGKVMFTDLQEKIYYIYVRYDGKDNSVGEMSTTEALQANLRHLIVIHIR